LSPTPAFGAFVLSSQPAQGRWSEGVFYRDIVSDQIKLSRPLQASVSALKPIFIIVGVWQLFCCGSASMPLVARDTKTND